MATSAAAGLVGQTLGGYKLVEIVGSGAMATVYKSYQADLDRWVAVKVLHYKEQSALVRFQREAKAIALLRHRNILIVYEYGEENSWPYIVMEYVQGGTLGDYIVTHPLDWAETINLVIPVAEALAYAHKQDIVHRDVKPTNVLLPQPDWPLLADFGLAKIPSSSEQIVTRSGTSMGTPAYVAPEQARGLAIDARSDIYSLGVVLFEMVTGHLPFDYTNPNKVLLAHISEPVPAPHRFNSNIPTTLEEIILKMLQKLPEDRYQDMAEIIQALRVALSSSNERSAVFYNPKTHPSPPSTVDLQTRNFTASTEAEALQLNMLGGTTPLPAVSSSASISPGPDIAPDPQFQARILITDKNETVPIPDKDYVIIGRTHRNTIADLDLGPYGAAKLGLSRHHARLTYQNNTWSIDDLGSLNGTFVNNVQVKPGTPLPLKNGDVIRCSHMSFVFLLSPRS